MPHQIINNIENLNPLIDLDEPEHDGYIKKLNRIELNNRRRRWKLKLLSLIINKNDNQQNLTNNEAQMVFVDKQQLYVADNNIPFFIPRSIDAVRESMKDRLQKSLLSIQRNDEYIQNETTDQSHHQYDTSVGLMALATYAQKIAFREILSIDESRQPPVIKGDDVKHEETYPITDFYDEQDLNEFEDVLTKQRDAYMNLPPRKPSDMIYMKFCCLFEINRDSSESCLSIRLLDIIFKFKLTDFNIYCELRIQKPAEEELVLERQIQGIDIQSQWGMEMKFLSFDWIEHQEVELQFTLKIESTTLLSNTFIGGAKFQDHCHLYVKNIPHGSSKIFLREMIPIARNKLRSRGYNVGQIEIEAVHWKEKSELAIKVIKITHSQAEKLLTTPETFVEVVFQDPFSIHDIKRTKLAERSFNPNFNEEFVFRLPAKTAISDITIDLLFIEQSPLQHNLTPIGILTLSKHTDWYPVRRFWAEVEQTPNVRHTDKFIFEGTGAE